jgi:hypothetical protein
MPKSKSATLTPVSCSVRSIFNIGGLFAITALEEDGFKTTSILLGKWIVDIHVSRVRRLGSVKNA